VDFFPYGYEGRQYCSPGFDLPARALSRTPHGRFREYHTSTDNLRLVRARALAEGSRVRLRAMSRSRVAIRAINHGES
jgi:aminopeptidase-like protein